MAAPSADLTRSLRTVIRRGITRWRLVVCLQIASLTIAAPLLYLWLLFIADNLLHLPTWARLTGSAGLLIGLAILLRRLIRYWQQQRARLTEDHVALTIEQRDAGRSVQNRLINSLQLSRGATDLSPRARKYLDAVMHENHTALQRVALQPPVRFSAALPLLAAALLAMLLGAAFWSLRPDHFNNAATRLFLPLADVEPIYRTRLTVEPGDADVERGEQLALRIYLEGEQPRHVVITIRTDAGRERIRLPLDGGKRAVTHMFEDMQHDVEYSVVAGDYTAPRRGWYRIRVLQPPKLETFEATIHPPAYTQREARTVRNQSGEVEALRGTQVTVRFQFDQPTRSATLTLGEQTIDLTRDDDQFTADLTLGDAKQYTLDLTLDDGRTHAIGPVRLTVIDDQPPSVELTGLDAASNVDLDTIAALKVAAQDDVGLRDVQLCAWPITDSQADAAGIPDGEPQVLQDWPGGNDPALSNAWDLVMPSLGAAEGARYVIAARARDHDPRKAGQWTYGRAHALHVTTTDNALQVIYDQLLATEATLRDMLDGYEQLSRALGPWLIKLDASSDIQWDKPAAKRSLRDAMNKQAAAARDMHEAIADAARQTAPPAQALQVSLAMLADTEAARIVRILETAAERDEPQRVRTALADGRVITQRIGQSLERMLAQHTTIREQWELAHMTPYLKMLAEQQRKLATSSARYGERDAAGDLDVRLRDTARRRQVNVRRMTNLASHALADLARRVGDRQATLAEAFAQAADALRADALTAPIDLAISHVEGSPWTEVAAAQTDAADALDAIHRTLRDAQEKAARDVLAKLQEQGKITVDEQGEIEQLDPGTLDNTFADDEAAQVAFETEIRVEKTEGDGKRFELNTNDWIKEALPAGVAEDGPQSVEPKEVQHLALSETHLAKRPGGQKSFPGAADLESTPHDLKFPNQTFADVMGALLEEADDLRKDYDTYNQAAAGAGGEESGQTGKNAGHLNAVSTGAVTGNLKPPTHDYGGGSAVGRGGGRAHGMALGDEARSMRGRDEAQQGQERAPIQEGSMREVETDDPQKDFSTGFGGKQLDTKDPVTFSTKDAGEWDDEILKTMGDPAETNKIVERMGKPMDPKVAELLRDLESDQEQLIERVKTIRKQFDDLYLPSEQLDRIIDEMTANLDRLKQQPDAEVFRQMIETLDRLRSVASVYNMSGSGFEPAVPRRQTIDGHILDEAPQPAMPGYERAVDIYYRNLAAE